MTAETTHPQAVGGGCDVPSGRTGPGRRSDVVAAWDGSEPEHLAEPGVVGLAAWGDRAGHA